MNLLKVCLSWLGALFLLTIVATAVLGSTAYDWFKETVGAFLTD